MNVLTEVALENMRYVFNLEPHKNCVGLEKI